MAIGDDAAAAGFDLVAGTDDRRNGWQEINQTRDYVAQTKTWATTQLAGKSASTHTHDDRYYTEAEVNSLISGINLSGKADAYGATNAVRLAEGPTSASYGRTATGSSWFAVWMNSSLQFMRNTSSKRYKKSIKTMTGNLNKVVQLRPVTYEARDETVTGTHIGLIAEEVYEVFPEIVPLDEKGRPEAVNYEFLVAPLIGAIKEQQAQIEALEARITSLEEGR